MLTSQPFGHIILNSKEENGFAEDCPQINQFGLKLTSWIFTPSGIPQNPGSVRNQQAHNPHQRHRHQAGNCDAK